ncbi:uncharacterized protein SETTUDRAFT_160209 [Exserohilum turcica Et28A]|uniref:Uncharacterized protein n=1 Tax=Exserohilum turcicum (strain 28A) TaxID=671987 RepID=R0K7V9_EXST2|nr:uncharacterized protein SETTUDRAFT_160209 [Exserohilum turcica Et28A]EOA89053.1 hypothetical protein SETTUDRAFT_160209 [Exserohilum turcica Et28A]
MHACKSGMQVIQTAGQGKAKQDKTRDLTGKRSRAPESLFACNADAPDSDKEGGDISKYKQR